MRAWRSGCPQEEPRSCLDQSLWNRDLWVPARLQTPQRPGGLLLPRSVLQCRPSSVWSSSFSSTWLSISLPAHPRPTCGSRPARTRCRVCVAAAGAHLRPVADPLGRRRHLAQRRPRVPRLTAGLAVGALPPRPWRRLGVALARRRPMRVARVLVHPPAQLGDLLGQQPVALAQLRVLRRAPLVAFDQRLGALTEQPAGQSQLRVLGAQLRQLDAQPNNIGACLRQRRPPRGEVAVHTDRRCDRGPPLWRSTVTDQGNTPSGLKNQVSSYSR